MKKEQRRRLLMEKRQFTEPPETGETGWNRNQKPLEVLPEAETVKKEKVKEISKVL